MPTNFPTFTAREILAAAKLNNLVLAVQSRITALTGANLSYPLVLGGNIDFNQQHSILGLRTFWNVINASEYTSLQAAIDAAEAAGGGLVFIPPDTTISADSLTIDQSVVIAGGGPTSIIQFGTASGQLMTTGTGGISGIGFMNLTIDGASLGAGQEGLIFKRVTDGFLHNVQIKNFTGDMLTLTNGGTPGQSTADFIISNCKFSGGGAAQIAGDDVDGLIIANSWFSAAGAGAIALEATNAAHLLTRILIDNCEFDTITGSGISILGQSGTASTNWSNITIRGCSVDSSTGTSIVAGTTAKKLKNIKIADCVIPTSGAKGMEVNAQSGSITGCMAIGATTVGLDLVDSEDIVVTGNNFRDATTYGINADGTTTCEIFGNVVSGAGTAGILGSSSTTLTMGGNYGFHSPSPSAMYIDTTSYNKTTTGDSGFTYTIPAGTMRVGDLLRIRFNFRKTGTNGAGSCAAQAAGASLGSIGSTSSSATDMAVQYDITCASLTGANTKSFVNAHGYVGAVGTSYDYSSYATAVTVDWTADVAITFSINVTAGDTNGISPVFIELLGGK